MTAGFFFAVVGMAMKARKRPIVSGREELIGDIGEVVDDFEHEGWIRVHGELWRATTSTPLRHGQKVNVIAINGLTLEVEPYHQHNSRED
jgi:membrane-bound serine protease (ClpP class)